MEQTVRTEKIFLSFDDLKGRQSVRATFRLPVQIIELLSLIAAQLGIKQKSLIDQLVADPSILRLVAREAQQRVPEKNGRRQKTFVLSRSSLDLLDSVASNEQVPRDVLVEFSIRRLLPVIESEQRKHEKRKILLQEMHDYLGQGKKIMRKAGALLGKDDQVYALIEQYVHTGEENIALLSGMVEKGRPMEDW